MLFSSLGTATASCRRGSRSVGGFTAFMFGAGSGGDTAFVFGFGAGAGDTECVRSASGCTGCCVDELLPDKGSSVFIRL